MALCCLINGEVVEHQQCHRRDRGVIATMLWYLFNIAHFFIKMGIYTLQILQIISALRRLPLHTDFTYCTSTPQTHVYTTLSWFYVYAIFLHPWKCLYFNTWILSKLLAKYDNYWLPPLAIIINCLFVTFSCSQISQLTI